MQKASAMVELGMKDMQATESILKNDNLLRYFHLLNQSRQVADGIGLKLITGELKRVKGKYLHQESLVDVSGEMI